MLELPGHTGLTQDQCVCLCICVMKYNSDIRELTEVSNLTSTPPDPVRWSTQKQKGTHLDMHAQPSRAPLLP